jgi:hypothetical protein
MLDTLKPLTKHTGSRFNPILGCVHIYTTGHGSRAQVGNGRYTVDVPCELPSMTVDLDRLVAAVNACPGTPTLHVDGDRVAVKAGRVRARLQLSTTPYPVATPDPTTDHPLADIGPLLTTLYPFAATDASRPWSTAICLSGDYAYATNNVCVARAPLPVPVGSPVNIPSTVVEAVTERGLITSVGYTDGAVTFYYGDGSWVRTLLIAGEWPTQVIDEMLAAVPDAWDTANADLGPLMVTAVKLSDERLPCVEFGAATMQLVDGSFVVDDLTGVPDSGRIAARIGALVFGIATHVQWHTPGQDRHAFRAGDLVGVFGGTK